MFETTIIVEPSEELLKSDELLKKAVEEIAKNHRQIIDDWCKAYLAQIYEEGHTDLKPGDFTLYEQDSGPNEKFTRKYWFEKNK